MKLSDTLLTSTQNLLARKWRTALNLLGVVVACTMLIMTFAGTRGVAFGIDNMIAALDGVSRFVIRPDWSNTTEPPPEVYEVVGQMSDARRERIKERLKQIWLAEFGEVKMMSPEVIDELAQIEHVKELVANFSLQCDITILDPQREDETPKLPGRATAILVLDDSVDRDIVAGRRLQPDDVDRVIVDEVFAYRMGYCSDDEIQDLIGKPLLLEFENGSLRDSSYYLLNLLGNNAGADISEKAQLLTAITELVSNLDQMPLTQQQKDQLRAAFGKLALQGRIQNDVGSSQDKSRRFLSKQLTVQGVIREARREGIENMLRLAQGHSTSEILVHPKWAEQIRSQLNRKRISRAIGTVDGIEHLEDVVQQIESRGYNVNSVASTIGRINKHINRILIGMSILAGMILLVAALTISNTLTISVMERTPEFGIMKAMGARDRDVLSMMLCEGAMTGVVGAIVATLASYALAGVIGYFVRDYVESQIRGDFSEKIFHFATLDILIAVAIGCVVCTLASIMPAFRAAKLDPIVAMRRK